MNKDKRNLVINVLGLAVGLGMIGTVAVYSKGTDRNTSPQEKVRYAQIEFRGKHNVSDTNPYELGDIRHVHYTLEALGSCQAKFDGTTTGIASLVFPASCPENVLLEGIVSTHREKCGPVTYGAPYRDPADKRPLFDHSGILGVKTSTSRDAPPVTTAIIGCR